MNQITTLAARFVVELRAELTPEQFVEVCQKNSTPKYQGGVCASHDYCDANMVMLRAFQMEVGREPVMDGGDSPIEQADHELWSAAWNYAHATALRAKPRVEYEDAEGIRVEISKDDGATVEFFMAGGGFSRKLARERFFEIFKVAGPRVMRRGRVDADWMADGETLPCWSDGSLWNGWSMPFFPREAVDQMIEQAQRDNQLFPMRWDGDDVLITEDPQEEPVRHAPATMPDGTQAWDIGAGSWCWNRIEFDEEEKSNDA